MQNSKISSGKMMAASNSESLNNFPNLIKKFIFNEAEILIVMVILGVWYLVNFPGAFMSSDALYADLAHHYLMGDFHYLKIVNPRPLTIYFMAVGEALFGSNSFGYVFFHFVFGLSCIYLTYKIGRELKNRFTGLFAAIFVGLTPAFSVHVVNATLETTRAFFVLALLFLALRFPKTDNLRTKRRYLILMGIVTACGLTAKQDMLFFIAAVFLYLLIRERSYVKSLILKYVRYGRDFKLIKSTVRAKKTSLILSMASGAFFGIAGKQVLDRIWGGLDAERQESVSGKLPPFLRYSVGNAEAAASYIYFLFVGIIVFMALWFIYIIIGYDIRKALKCIVKPRKLNRVQKLLLYLISGMVAIFVIYLPFIFLPHYLIYRIILVYFGPIIGTFMPSFAAGGEGHLVGLAGETYTKPPLWAYFYWIYQNLGPAYVIGFIVSVVYTLYMATSKDKNKIRQYTFLYFYLAIPFMLYHLRSIKLFYHLFPLFPLFSIYISTHIFDAGARLAQIMPSLSRKNIPNYVGAVSCAILIILPGSPLLSTISDPDIKTDSGYDIVAEQVIAFALNHSNETVTMIVHDSFTLEYYMGEDMPDNFIIFDRLWSNKTEEELYAMVLLDEIWLMVEVDDSRVRDSDLDIYVKQQAVSEYKIETSTTDTIIYYLRE